MYTAVALSALLDAGNTIVPVSHVRRRDKGPIKHILGSFPDVDTSGITSPADQGDVSSCVILIRIGASSGRRTS